MDLIMEEINYGLITFLEINPMIYGLNPDVFAVKAYRHYFNPGVGVAFMQTLLHRDLMSIFPQWEIRAARDPLAGDQTGDTGS